MPSPLLELPPELRNNIVELVICGCDSDHDIAKLCIPALSQTCQQLRSEVLPIFRHHVSSSRCTFHITVLSNYNDFLWLDYLVHERFPIASVVWDRLREARDSVPGNYEQLKSEQSRGIQPREIKPTKIDKMLLRNFDVIIMNVPCVRQPALPRLVMSVRTPDLDDEGKADRCNTEVRELAPAGPGSFSVRFLRRVYECVTRCVENYVRSTSRANFFTVTDVKQLTLHAIFWAPGLEKLPIVSASQHRWAPRSAHC